MNIAVREKMLTEITKVTILVNGSRLYKNHKDIKTK